MRLNDAFDKQIIEEFHIKPEIKRLSKEKRLQLLDRLFKQEYQGKVVTYAMLEKELFVKTTAKTRLHFAMWRNQGAFSGYLTKLNLSAGGDYIPLISNCKYVHSAEEAKPGQSKLHRNTKQWHYFAKEILCDGERFRVRIDVRENKRHDFMVYNVTLNPAKNKGPKLKEHSDQKNRRDLINSARLATDSGGKDLDEISSANNIPHAAQNVNRENKKSLTSLLAEAESRKATVVGNGGFERSQKNEKSVRERR